MRYSENPNLKLIVVTSAFGKKEYKRNCRLIKGEYYIENEECFLVNNQWHRINNGLITFDYEKKEWTLISLIKNFGKNGIVEIKENQPITGWFSNNPYENVAVNNYQWAINKKVIENHFTEDISNNIWIENTILSKSEIKELSKIRKSSTNFGWCQYNIDDDKILFNKSCRLYESYSTNISKSFTKLSRFIGDVSFGIEVETSLGNVAPNTCNQLGLIPCKDGSLGQGYKSAEWVSVPMRGAKGLQNITNIATTLSKRCNIDLNCSYHIHYGTIPTTRNYIVSLYKLSYAIQNELFEMFPYYKIDWRDVKQKNYCQKLKKLGLINLKDESKEGYHSYINFAYKQIFILLSEGIEPNQEWNSSSLKHPIQNKWDRKSSRYFFQNLQNLIFSPRKTAELRLHTGTTNPIKMITWFFMGLSIIKYASIHEKEILTGKKITLFDVFDYYKNTFKTRDAVFLSDYLKAYYTSQKNIFFSDWNERQDKISMYDITNDKMFDFKLNGLNLLEI